MVYAPCKDCPDRHYKCHSECEKYKLFVVENKKKKDAEKLKDEIINDTISRLIYRRNN